MTDQASLIFICGMRGCGKSTLTHRISDQPQFSRKVIFDVVEEWNDSTHIVYSFEEFSNVWREVFHRPSFSIAVRFDFGSSEDFIQSVSTQIVTLVYRTGRETHLATCLIFEEAQFYFPSNYMHPVFKSLITTGRHASISMIANTQRPASVHKLLISQSPEIYSGRLFETNDIKYLTATLGDVGDEISALKPFEFIYFCQGYPEKTVIVSL